MQPVVIKKACSKEKTTITLTTCFTNDFALENWGKKRFKDVRNYIYNGIVGAKEWIMKIYQSCGVGMGGSYSWWCFKKSTGGNFSK